MSGTLKLFPKEKSALGSVSPVQRLRGNHGRSGFMTNVCLHLFRCNVVLGAVGAFRTNFLSFYSMLGVQMQTSIKDAVYSQAKQLFSNF